MLLHTLTTAQGHREPRAINTQTHICLTALCLGLPVWERKVKENLDFTEARTVSGSGSSWTVCKSAPHSKQMTIPAPHHSVLYTPDALSTAHKALISNTLKRW